MITADAVLNTRFSATRFRKGYDMEQVDIFLDRVVATLSAHEGLPNPHGIHGSGGLRPQDVREQRFPSTTFREGYDVAEVDAFLDRIVVTLSEHERRRPAYASDAPAGASSAVATEQSADDAPTGPTISLREATALLRTGRARFGSAGSTLTIVTTDGVTLRVTDTDEPGQPAG